MGNVPFGFHLRADGRTLERDEREQAIIARAHELRAVGVSLRGIVAKLASEGIVGRSGRPLCKAAVENVLRRAA